MKIESYTVKPRIPAALKPLEEIAHNLWLSWNFEAIQLFIRLDFDLWMHSRQSPARMLGMISQKRLEEVAKDDSYMAALKEVYAEFTRYKKARTWYRGSKKDSIAYFSMEYGMDVSLPIYSGGLGILSGDHMKTASDLGLPLVGVGLLYRQGYFQQKLNADGFQQESYPENDWYNMPVTRRTGPDGNPLTISVDFAGREARAQIWEVKVGRSSLFLLDANIPENPPDIRDVTATLYGGDRETRIRQEILLGMGGIRALRALGINPAVSHMNEGHSAFLALERAHEMMAARNFSFREAWAALWSSLIFTTHTPVPAGNERFDETLVKKYFAPLAQNLGLSWKGFMALGRVKPDDESEQFCMTVLALKMSAWANGVSRLHGEVSRTMWKDIWPEVPIEEIPIGHVTNGVHPRTWVSNNMVELLDRYFGPHFRDEPTDLSIWERMDRISDEELWRTHDRRRERLVGFARDRIRQQLRRNGATESRVQQAEDALSPYTLTIAFARRFATYKRAKLLLRDKERLLRLLRSTDHPIQLIFAGKAHPHDLPGKDLIRALVHFAEEHDVVNKLVFLEDYDMTMARYLTSGADLWLNTPRRPLEASGTSGMKAAVNGVLNCSVLDGWWDEAYQNEVGWAIGRGEHYEDTELQDDVESKALYDLLEREIIPLFYQRGRDNLPREWIKRMKASMRHIGQSMSSHRMLMEYAEGYYYPALKHWRELERNDFAESSALAAYLAKLDAAWPAISIVELSSNIRPLMQRGDSVNVTAKVDLAGLSPKEVCVELWFGTMDAQGKIAEPKTAVMKHQGSEGGLQVWQLRIPCEETGRQGHSVRLLPCHPALVHRHIPGYIKWPQP